MTDNTLILRAQELINKSEVPISGHAALRQAALDRFLTREAMADALASLASSALNKLRQSTYTLPEQPGLFDIPSVISNNTPEGPLFIGRDNAQLDHVRKWLDEGDRFHSSQKLRFKRGKEYIKLLHELPGDLPWVKARLELEASVEEEPTE